MAWRDIMTDWNNNLNINSVGKGHAPSFKKGDKTGPTVPNPAPEQEEDLTVSSQRGGEVLGRSQVSKSADVNFKADMKAFEKNPALAANVINAGDLSYELMDAQGITDAYEKSCCGSIDAFQGKI